MTNWHHGEGGHVDGGCDGGRWKQMTAPPNGSSRKKIGFSPVDILQNVWPALHWLVSVQSRSPEKGFSHFSSEEHLLKIFIHTRRATFGTKANHSLIFKNNYSQWGSSQANWVDYQDVNWNVVADIVPLFRTTNDVSVTAHCKLTNINIRCSLHNLNLGLISTV